MPYVIFTIDFENNPHRMNVFMNYLAEVQQESAGLFLPCIGKYNGKLEHCFICRTEDFDEFIRNHTSIRGQESVLHVASGNKMECWLEYLDGSTAEPAGTRVGMGCLHEVCAEEAMQSTAFLFRPDMGKYWIAKHGNPDGSIITSTQAYAPQPAAVHDTGLAAQ